ncbi:hypothetical protein AL035_20275 [Salipiger aestuarii]|uniref:Thioredoxin-like protein n=1 Tax=Salipiger aestuarii TaxID=568098 RepID=A0A327XI76_9RHOB|nr:thioredoxin family protein [Salipiger aestuarii]KAB2535265.1 hypothetical protein AL035_20275 [Salipiger aestuarii]RAK08553.1 hypothetical protein ATI53_10784 [Salipiger aestuarii]
MSLIRLICIAFPAALLAGPVPADTRLVMVAQPGCAYCAQWNAEIAPAYPNTTEGRFAPLLQADLRADPPDGVRYDRKVLFTPTFILIQDGTERARIEGYPGQDFFWPLLARMLTENTDYDPQRAADAATRTREVGDGHGVSGAP